MTKQTPGSPNVRRMPTGFGEQVHFVRPEWQQECDAHDGGRKPPSYKPVDGQRSMLEPHPGDDRTIT